MVTFESILDRVAAYMPKLDRQKLIKVFKYASKAHAGQYRMSGDPYIDHSLSVVDIMLALKPGENDIIAALLHGLSETPFYDLKEIEASFGSDVAGLVSAITFLNKLKTPDSKSENVSLRKMVLAMAQDLRVILIKLADRLDNLRTLDFHTSKNRKIIAKETMEIYVPIAARLGIYNLKVKLEDVCFKYLYPRQYEDLTAQLNEYLLKRGKNMEEIKAELAKFLQENKIESRVDGRIKNLYSIYRKLKFKSNTTIDDIFDVFAIRIIVPDKKNSDGVEVIDHLYSILGLIHSKWKPLANRFKDYLAVPKPNGYQSLHTAVIGLSPKSFNQPTEIQIRSQRMHEEAENGIASHWLYEDSKKSLITLSKDSLKQVLGSKNEDLSQKDYFDWLAAITKLQKNSTDGKDLLKALKLDVFNDRIFVFTPTGEVKDLPQGSTPVDFAYSVHSDIGNHCQLAKVNGNVVPLNYELQNGEIVEIVLNNKITPKLQWLSLVKTSLARNKIRAYLRSLDSEFGFKEGKEITNKALSKMNKPLLNDELSIFKEYQGKKLSLKERVALVEEIGNGSILIGPVLKNVFGLKRPGRLDLLLAEENTKGKIILPAFKQMQTNVKSNEVYIAGEGGLPYRFANCCKPVLNQPIAGYITRGHSVSIHLKGCRLLKSSQQERLVDASWGRQKELKKNPVTFSLKAKNRRGLISDIADIIFKSRINVLDFGKPEFTDKDVTRQIVLEIGDSNQYNDLLEKLQQVVDVYAVDGINA